MMPELGSPTSDLSSMSKPQPRPPKSPEKSAHIRIQNRRREYLERHPDYFNSIEHEFADLLLYDTLIRRFQSAAEREAEGRAKGYGRILEGSLGRTEERREKVAQSAGDTLQQTSISGPIFSPDNMSSVNVLAAPSFALESELAPPVQTKEEGQQRWQAFLRDRFIHGGDNEFAYPAVDEDDEYDAHERREQEDAWFDGEDPGWASDASGEELDAKGQRMKVDILLQGETGIQDF